MEWIRFYTRKWLWGSGRDMQPEERGVWADLMALAGETKLRDGALRFDVEKPMPRAYIATVLRIELSLLDYCLDLFGQDINVEDGAPRVEIWEDGTIFLTNFVALQGGDAKALKEAGVNRIEEKRNKQASAIAKTKREIARKYANLYPDISLDVIRRDFGYEIVNKQTGEIVGKEGVK